MHDGVGEKEAQERLQPVLQPDIVLPLFVDKAPDDGQQKSRAAGNREEAKVPGQVAAAIAVGEQYIHDYCREKDKGGLEPKVFYAGKHL